MSGIFDMFGGDDEKKKRRREEEARRQREEEQRQREEAAEEREAAIEEREKERQAQEEERQAQAEAERAARQKALEQMASETESFAQEFAQSSKPQSSKPQGPDAGAGDAGTPDSGPVQPIVAEANRQVDRGLGRMGSTADHVGSQAQGQLGGRSLNLPQSPAIQGQASQVIGDASRPQGPQRTPGQFTPSQLGQGRPPAGSPQSLQTAAQAPQQNQGGQGTGQSSTSPGQPPGAPQTPMAPPVQAPPAEDLVQIQRRINQGRQGQGQAERDAAVRDRALNQTDRALEGLRPEGLRNIQAQYNQNAMLAEEEPSTAPSTPPVSRPVPINEDTPERQLQRTEQMGLLDPWSSDMGTAQSPEEAALAQMAGGDVPGINVLVDEIQTSPRRAQDRTQLPDNVEADLGRATEALREGVEQPVAYDAEGNPLPPQTAPREQSRRTPSPRIQQAVAEGRVDPTVAPELENIDNDLRQQVQRDLENGDITEEEAAAINAAIDQNISGQAQEVTVSEDNNAIPPSAQQPTTEQPTTEQPTAEGPVEGSGEAQSEDERVENEDGLTQEEVQEILNDPEPPSEEVMETLRTFSENDQELRDMQAGLAAVRQINSRLAEAIENQLQDNTPTTFEEEIDRAREQRSKARRLAVIGKVLAFVGLFLGHASGSEDMMGLGVLIGKLLGGISKTNEEAATADLEALEQQRQNVEGGQMAELQRYQALAQARMAEVEQLNRMRGQRQADERLRLQDERNQQRYELDQRRLEEDRALDDPDSELSEIERRNLSVINGTLVQRGFRGLSPEEIEMMSGRAARSTRVQLERVLGNRNVRGGGLGGAGGVRQPGSYTGRRGQTPSWFIRTHLEQNPEANEQEAADIWNSMSASDRSEAARRAGSGTDRERVQEMARELTDRVGPDIPRIRSQMRHIASIYSRASDEAKRAFIAAISGDGPIESAIGFVGSMASNDIQELRSAFSGIRGFVQRELTGATATSQEAQRILASLGGDLRGRPEVFERVFNSAYQDLGNVAIGELDLYEPDIQEVYVRARRDRFNDSLSFSPENAEQSSNRPTPAPNNPSPSNPPANPPAITDEQLRDPNFQLNREQALALTPEQKRIRQQALRGR